MKLRIRQRSENEWVVSVRRFFIYYKDLQVFESRDLAIEAVERFLYKEKGNVFIYM